MVDRVPSFDEVLIPLRRAQDIERQRLQALEAERQAAEEAARQAEAQRQADIASQAQTAYIQAQNVSYALPADQAKSFIYMRESGNNPSSINASSGACGLGQALPCSKMPCSLSDYACQDSFFTGYMLARYGSWANAYAFWLKMHWW